MMNEEKLNSLLQLESRELGDSVTQHIAKVKLPDGRIWAPGLSIVQYSYSGIVYENLSRKRPGKEWELSSLPSVFLVRNKNEKFSKPMESMEEARKVLLHKMFKLMPDNGQRYLVTLHVGNRIIQQSEWHLGLDWGSKHMAVNTTFFLKNEFVSEEELSKMYKNSEIFVVTRIDISEKTTDRKLPGMKTKQIYQDIRHEHRRFKKAYHETGDSEIQEEAANNGAELVKKLIRNIDEIIEKHERKTLNSKELKK